ncbi:MAG TPA: transporter substrate-binding domain-containing protein [Cyclobacteriaceae bacterium]|nr:transporter substrate-binding domain-containing protein [Cyclobacteriaceae bacterium]
MARSRNILWVLIAFCPIFSCQRPVFNPEIDAPPTAGIDLDSIQKRGYINALVDNNSISYFIYKGQPMGYDYELLRLFADHINVRLKINVTTGIETAMGKLNSGEGDIMAFPLTITKQRKQHIAFTRPHFNSYQVLVQRKSENWREITVDQNEEAMIRHPAELVGKEVHVLKNSSFIDRLENLSEEIGGDILIRVDTSGARSEELIEMVSNGQIDLTAADHAIAAVNAAYYPNIDVSTVLSLPQQIAWGVRPGSPKLLEAFNTWLEQIKKEPTFMVIYNRYYKSPRTSRIRMNSDYSSLGGNKLSPYDDLIKIGASTLGWDWRLLAAVVYQESRFETDDESWAGARGFMQLMPQTAKRFGAVNVDDPVENLQAGVKYLQYLDNYWMRTVDDPEERTKFVLASYNAGLGHILDARDLAAKYGKDTGVWESNVEVMLLSKSQPEYFEDPVVRLGHCRCRETVNYVREVLNRYDQYSAHIATDFPIASQ